MTHESRTATPARPRWDLNPVSFIRSMVRHRALIKRLAIRQIQNRYVGSMLGLSWAILQPLLMLAVYTFVFSVVMQMKWGVSIDNRGHFALILYSGLLAFNIVQHCLVSAPRLIAGNPSFVSKVVFPLEILPAVVMVEALFDALLGFCVFLALYLVVLGVPPLTIVGLPLIVFPICLFSLGAMWFLSSVGVYVRDLSQFIGVLTTILLFLSPIFYPFEIVPERFRFLLLANPLTPSINEIRNLAFSGVWMRWQVLIPSVVVSGAVAWAGYAWFMVTKRGFSDVV